MSSAAARVDDDADDPRAAVSTDELADPRPGEELDAEAIRRYLQTELDGVSGPCRVRQFTVGAANLTYLIEFEEASYVLRRPPMGALAPGAHDMNREFVLLSRLWRHYDRAPRALLLCRDRSVIGADFFVMEYRRGRTIRGELPRQMAHIPDAGHRLGLAVVDALAELHRLRPDECGLADLGRPKGFLSRQLSGWRKRWGLVASAGNSELMSELGERLERSVPSSSHAVILHNDYKIDNCQFQPDDPARVTAVFDWDMATLGDPLVDLGITLNYWPDPDWPGEEAPMYPPGLETLGVPTHAEVIERYTQRTGYSVRDIAWYEAFACWRLGVILQQLYARFVRGESTDPRLQTRGMHVALQARRGRAILDRAGL